MERVDKAFLEIERDDDELYMVGDTATYNPTTDTMIRVGDRCDVVTMFLTPDHLRQMRDYIDARLAEIESQES